MPGRRSQEENVLFRKKAAVVLLAVLLALYAPMTGLAAVFTSVLSQNAGLDIEAKGDRAVSYRAPRLSASAPADTLALVCGLLVQAKEAEIITISDYAIPLSAGEQGIEPDVAEATDAPSEAEEEPKLGVVELDTLDILEQEDLESVALTPIPSMEEEDTEAPIVELASEAVTPHAAPEVASLDLPPEEVPEASPVVEVDTADIEPAVVEVAEVPPAIEPLIAIDCYYDGEMMPGTAVTLSAQVSNTPEDAVISYQWQNDAGGTFEDVPGATELTYVFHADGSNRDCQWRLRLSFSYAD